MLTVWDSNPGGMLKTTVSKAAADDSTGGVAPGYVEDAFKARTKLADVFSIPLKNGPPLCGTPELPSEQGDVQQSFSRSRLIAPRLRLPLNPPSGGRA
mgnify:CR=1 FL=1